MNDKNKGEPVFTNIDDVLAEKIVSRSKENNEHSFSEPEEQTNTAAQTVPDQKERSFSITKGALVFLTALIGLILFLRLSKKL
ncbi:MAG: hypothetical protein ACLFQB_09695 [Chitinispirillaceae bacterium]